MVVSHDRAFLNRFARRILEIDRGRIRQFEGNYDDYREQRALEDRQAWENYQAQQRRIAAAERAAERRSRLRGRWPKRLPALEAAVTTMGARRVRWRVRRGC